MRDSRRVLEELDESEHLDVLVAVREDAGAHPPSSIRWVVAVTAAVLAGTLLLQSNDPERSDVDVSVPVGRAASNGVVEVTLTRIEPGRGVLRMWFESSEPDPRTIDEAAFEIGMAGSLAPIRETARARGDSDGFHVTIPFEPVDGRIMRVTITSLRYRNPGVVTAPIDLSGVWPRPAGAPAAVLGVHRHRTTNGMTFSVQDVVAEGSSLAVRVRYAPPARRAYFGSVSLQVPPRSFPVSGQYAETTGLLLRWENLPRDVRWATMIASDAVLEYGGGWTWLAPGT